jgi:hypothetical protein
MSTHAQIFMPSGPLVLYKHYDGRPKNVLPALSMVINESSIFLRTGRGGAGEQMWNGTQKQFDEEMGYLAHRIIITFALRDYRRRTSTGIKFTDKDLTGLVGAMAIEVINRRKWRDDQEDDGDLNADYEYRIERNGDISFFNTDLGGTPRVLPYGTDMTDALHQLALIGADDDIEPVDPR